MDQLRIDLDRHVDARCLRLVSHPPGIVQQHLGVSYLHEEGREPAQVGIERRG
jgi:hypothetical protein